MSWQNAPVIVLLISVSLIHESNTNPLENQKGWEISTMYWREKPQAVERKKNSQLPDDCPVSDHYGIF